MQCGLSSGALRRPRLHSEASVGVSELLTGWVGSGSAEWPYLAPAVQLRLRLSVEGKVLFDSVVPKFS